MAIEQQDVYITGNALEDWSTEATQTKIHGSLKQIQADGNAMIRFLHHIANGTKISQKELKKAVTEIQKNTTTEAKANQREKITDNKLISSQQKIASSSRASISAITGLGDSIIDSERKQKKRDGIRDALLDANFSKDAAEKGADRKMQVELGKRIKEKTVILMAAAKGVVDLATGAVSQGFSERFAMVAEMRQAGLLARMTDTETGFISMSKTISNTNFTFGEATEFTKRFSQAVGVNGVKSALSFANTVASGTVENGMGYMEKYALEFGQVSNIAGEYLDTLRIGGQLRGMDDRSMRAGMEDFMSNVEMTSNVLKISMEEAANLMQKALGPDSVALLATLPKEQREAIEEGFLSVNAQGNPMAETLAKRLAAGSRAAFQQTAEWQEMAGTAPGREVLKFVEEMALKLQTGDTKSFQSGLAEGFPELADRLVELSSRGGVRVQLLNDPQLASMVGQIITAAQTYGDADKGTQKAIGAEDKAMMANLIQLREAAVLNESAINNHMKTFTKILQDLVKIHRNIARSTALMIEDYTGVIHTFTKLSKWWEGAKGWGLVKLMDFMTSEDLSKHPAGGVLDVLKLQGQAGYGKEMNQKELTSMDNMIDANTKKIMEDLKAMQKMNLPEDQQYAILEGLRGQLGELATQVGLFAGAADKAELFKGNEGDKNWMIWKDNLKALTKNTTKVTDLIDELQGN